MQRQVENALQVCSNIIFRLKVFEDTDKSSKDHPTVVEQRACLVELAWSPVLYLFS